MPDREDAPARDLPDLGPSRRIVLSVVSLAFLLAFGGSLWLHSGSTLYDTDSYYHLAIARTYAEEGVVHELPWLRYSVMRDGFGDKEFLFHLLLVPFVSWLDPLAAGRLALAVLAALLAATLAWLGSEALAGQGPRRGQSAQSGWWAGLLPLWIFYASPEFAWRVVRLRPELLSLFLLLVAIWAMGRGRYRLVGVLAAIYALSYTAFHAFLGLTFLTFGALGWWRRRWPWALPLYAGLGTGVGLLVHPHFPKNLEIWAVQNLQFFLQKSALAVGSEIRPNFTDVVLMVQLGWFLGLAVLWRSAEKRAPEEDEKAPTLAWGVATLVFGVLYLLMSRFSVYFIPVATVWLLVEMKRRGLRLTPWTRLPGRGRLPLAAAVALVAAVSFPEAWRQFTTYRARTDPGPEEGLLQDRRAVGEAIPPGARVAAVWGTTPVYLLWAPQGRYVNVLDPVFMATPYPDAYRRQRSIFEGREPDVPWTASTVLNSDYLAYTVAGESPLLTQRLSADPRVEVLYRKRSVVVRFVPGANTSFVRDWKVLPPGRSVPVPAEEPVDSWLDYPLSTQPQGRAMEAYVDARRLGSSGCAGFLHDEEVDAPTQVLYEFAPYGPSSIWLDGDLLLSSNGDLKAVLGQGTTFGVTLHPGSHRMTVLACPAKGSQDGHAGFYLLQRSRQRVGPTEGR